MVDKLTLERAVNLFLGDYKASSARAYRQGLNLLMDELDDGILLVDVTPVHIVVFATGVLRGGRFAAATRFKHLKTIKTFFNFCVRMSFIDKSPAQAVKNTRPARRITREKAMTDAELDAILKVLNRKTIPRDYALVIFLADTGCRAGGAAGLRLRDVDFTTKTAVVTEKGDKQRKVAFSTRCAEAIQRWFNYRTRHYAVKDDYVFSRDGLPACSPNISLIIRRACRAAGVRVLSSHSLRHRKGHQFADARIAPSIAATALGHSDVSITLSFYYPSDWETAEQALRELMGEGKKRKVISFPDVDEKNG